MASEPISKVNSFSCQSLKSSKPEKVAHAFISKSTEPRGSEGCASELRSVFCKVCFFLVICFINLLLKSDSICPLYLIFTGFRFLQGDGESLVTPDCISAPPDWFSGSKSNTAVGRAQHTNWLSWHIQMPGKVTVSICQTL